MILDAAVWFAGKKSRTAQVQLIPLLYLFLQVIAVLANAYLAYILNELGDDSYCKGPC